MAKTILLVDDSEPFRMVVGDSLREAGYAVIEASDGREALAMLDGRKLHLIVSDVNMPEMDGIEFAKASKALAAYRFTPIVMMTSVVDEERKHQGRLIGVRAWVVKPFQPQTLLDAISMLVPL